MVIVKKIAALCVYSLAIVSVTNAHANENMNMNTIDFDENQALPVGKCLVKCATTYKNCLQKAVKKNHGKGAQYKKDALKCVQNEQKCQIKCAGSM